MSPSKGVMSYSLFRESSDSESRATHVENPPPPLSKNNIHISGIDISERREADFLLQSEVSKGKEHDSPVHIKDPLVKPPDSAVESQSSVHKGQSPALPSQDSIRKGSGSVIHSKSVVEKKSNSASKKSDSVPHRTSSVDKESSSVEYVQNSVGKRPASVSHLVDAADKTLHSQVDAANGTKNDIQKSTHLKSSNKDGAEVQSNITSQMLHLTEKIEENLEKMIQEPEHNQDGIFDPASPQAQPISKNAIGDQHNGLQPARKGIQPETQSTIVNAQLTLQTTRATRTQTETPSPTLKAKINKINAISNKSVSSSVYEEIEHAIDHVSSSSHRLVASSSPKDVLVDQPTTKTKVQVNGHKALATLPMTHPTPLVALTTKTLTATQKTSNNTHTLEPVQPSRPVTVVLKDPDQSHPVSNDLKHSNHNLNSVEISKKTNLLIPEVEKHSVSEDVSGLVAALVFGVVFLLVVIGLIGRKVSEARRRHQYNKLDYLINGMYVDT